MVLVNLSRRDVEYLFTIYEIELNFGLTKTLQLAKRMNVSPSTASAALKRLSNLGLVRLSYRRGAKLTREGLEIVLDMLWRHGVLEQAFIRMGLNINEACEVAYRIQHLLPKEALYKICEALGHPYKCPHGYEIPHPGKLSRKKYEICKPRTSF